MKALRIWLAGLVIVTSAMAETPEQKEWHEYCEMTVHIKVDGWYTEKTSKEISVPFDEKNVRCQVEVYTDFLGKRHTQATAYLDVQTVQPLLSQKSMGLSAHVFAREGVVSETEACVPLTELIAKAKANGGKLTTTLAREVVRQDWTSPKNTDVRIIEQATLKVDGKIHFSGVGQSHARGKYCSQKPQ